jgi:hypothetical protein
MALLASCTWKVTEGVPAVVGIPLNTPVDRLKLSPGTLPLVTDKVYGGVPPEGVMVPLYANVVSMIRDGGQATNGMGAML